MVNIINRGDVLVSIPNDDGTSYGLEPGASIDVRQGNAEFAVRSFPGVEYDPVPNPHGLAEASTGGAIEPIGAYVEANPTHVRYAPVNDTHTVSAAVEVIGGEQLAVVGGPEVSPTGTLPGVAAVPGEPGNIAGDSQASTSTTEGTSTRSRKGADKE